MLTKIKSNTSSWVREQKKKIAKGYGFRSLTMCGKCYTFYYKNSWHFEKPKEIDCSVDATIPVRFTQCSACVEQELSLYNVESESFA